VSANHQKPFIPAWLDDAGLSPAEFRVLCHLIRRADNKTGIAWPSYASMTESLAMSKSTINRSIASLEKRGLLAKTGKPFGGSCRYRVLPIVSPEGRLKDAANSVTREPIGSPPIVSPENHNSPSNDTPIVSPEGKEGIPIKDIHLSKSTFLGKTVEVLPFDSDDFRNAWSSWRGYWNERGSNLTTYTVNAQLDRLRAMGEVDAIASIAQCIAANGTSLLPPMTPSSTQKKRDHAKPPTHKWID
jgi:predicted transcriptional regulator